MAVTFDFGTCAACGENNSKTLQQCRSCGAALPWSKAKKASAPAPIAAPQNSPSKTKIDRGEIAYGAMTVQLLGGLLIVVGVFLWLGNRYRFFPSFPFAGQITALIGFAMWRYGAEMV